MSGVPGFSGPGAPPGPAATAPPIAVRRSFPSAVRWLLLALAVVAGAAGFAYLFLLNAGGPSASAKSLSVTFGAEGDDAGFQIIPAPDGYIIVGQTSSYGSGQADIWVMKVDSAGRQVWAHTYGGPDRERVFGRPAVATGGDTYLIATSSSSVGAGGYDGLVLKLDGSGEKVWSQTFGGAKSDYLNSADVTTDGGYILAGIVSSFGAGYYDAWLIRLGASGDKIWSRTYGSADADAAYAARATPDGGCVVGGYTGDKAWFFKVDASGAQGWSRTWSLGSGAWVTVIEPAGDGGYYLLTLYYSDTEGTISCSVYKTDAEGREIWSFPIEGPGVYGANGLSATSDGGCVVCGWFLATGAETETPWLLKLDARGGEDWRATYPMDGSVVWVEPLRGGRFMVAGYMYPNSGAERDLWLATTDRQGRLEVSAGGGP
ncbi:MAG: hypothetical protein C4551_10845 [Bacillota bacterium]|nr:MAG: hypothetical protein C4551_10845 [Bacillota bacterium]